jgi:hypothetical protein
MSLGEGQKNSRLACLGGEGTVGGLHSPAGMDAVHTDSIRRNTMQFIPSDNHLEMFYNPIKRHTHTRGVSAAKFEETYFLRLQSV